MRTVGRRNIAAALQLRAMRTQRNCEGGAEHLSLMDRSSACAYRRLWMLLAAVLAAGDGVFFRALFAQEWQDHPAGQVLELSDSNFDSAISNFHHILVDFYAPWCGHCKALAPELDEAAPLLAKNSPSITVAKLDAEKFSAISNKYKINAYPTLKLFINGVATDYNGPRRADLIVSSLQRLVAPDVVTLHIDSDLSKFILHAGENLPIFIGFGMEESSLSAVAIKIKHRAWFAIIRDPSEQIMVDYDFDKKPCLLVLQPKADERHLFYGPFEDTDTADFIYQNLLPSITTLNYESLKFVKEDARPIALAIVDDEASEESKAFLKKLKTAVPANRDFVFASVSLVEWPEFVETFNVGKNTLLPLLYIWNGGPNYYSSQVYESEVKEEAEFGFLKLFHDFRENKAVKHKIKQPSFLLHIVESLGQNILYIIVFFVTIFIFLQNSELGFSARRLRTADEDEIENKPLNGNPSEKGTINRNGNGGGGGGGGGD